MLISCSDTDLNEKWQTHKLIKHQWEVESYVDNSINELIEVSQTTYDFYNDGSLIKTYQNGDSYEITWSWYDENKYLVIGDNTFKINTLTNRLLGISYGEVDIFFVPVD